MVCEYFCQKIEACRKGLPLMPLYIMLICNSKPERCLVAAVDTNLLDCA
jgi:hypothetical protein